MIICYYHNDADGIISGALVNYFLKGKKKFIKAEYGMKIDWEMIGTSDSVFVVDFSFPPHEMEKLCLLAENVVWIDHHVSAIKDWEDNVSSMKNVFPDYDGNIDGIRKIGESGCQLTEQYFAEKFLKNGIPQWHNDSVNSKLVEMIGTYDVWNKENEYVNFDDAYQCMLGVLERGYTPESEDLKIYFDNVYDHDISPIADINFTDVLVYEGNIVKKYLERFQNEKISRKSFETSLFGKRAIAVNTPLKGAAPLLEKYYEGNFDIMCVYFFNGKMWEYSFYTEKDSIDCSMIARSLSKDDTKIGGGHRKAAGCTLTKNLFNNRISLAMGDFTE